MILLETKNLYYNTQVYFWQHYMSYLDNDDKVWAAAYLHWLKNQGAEIVRSDNKGLIRNALGLAPGYDKFGFKNEQNAVWFALKWS